MSTLIRQDTRNMCRVCMRSDQQQMILIFDEEQTISAMMSEIIIYKVQRSDDLPDVICALCLKGLRNAYHLKRQCEESHRKFMKLLNCAKDGNSFKEPLDFIKIETTEHNEKSTQTECEPAEHSENEYKGSTINCRFCSQTFNRVEYLKTHMAVAHTECMEDAFVNQCPICKRQFTRRGHMRRHLAVIHKIVEIDDMDMEKPSEWPEKTKSNFAVSEEPQEEDYKDECIKQNIVEVLQPVLSAKSNSVRETDGESEEEQTEYMYDTHTAANSDDEDEKPLSKLINISPTKGFIEVLLNETLVDENIKLDECVDHDLIANKKSIKREHTSEMQEDVLSPLVKKRGRGRPPRTVKKPAVNSSSEENEYKCKDCDKIFQHHTTLLRHKLKHHTNDTKYTCKICLKFFNSADFLRSHIKTVHSAARIMKCDECDKEFTHIAQYNRHKEAKHSEKVYNCEMCEKSFTTKVYLQRHMAIHNKKRYVCKECSQSHATKEELNDHIKAEGHDKPMLCPECGLRCKTSNILMVHMRRHNGEKPFKCKFCSKGFPRMDDLRVHEKYHTGEKSHFCETCGKGFQRKYNLTIHLRVHTGEKPYKCPHCPQAFAQGNDLKAHIRRHTGERFRCEVCGAAFLQGYQIRQHKLTEHGIKEDPPTQRVAKFTSHEEQQEQIKQNLQKELSGITNTTESSGSGVQLNESSSTMETMQETLQNILNI